MALGNSLKTEVDYTWRMGGTQQSRSSMATIARGAAGVATAAVTAGAALFALANRVTAPAAALEDMSRRTGIAVETLAELEYIAKQDGAELATLQTGIRTLASAVTDANAGLATYQRAFEQVGLSYQMLGTMSPTEQFYAVSDAISQLEDDSLRMSVAQDLMGRGGLALIPTMNRGADELRAFAQEAHDLGIVLDEEAYEASKQFQDAITEVESRIQGALLDSIVTLLPQIEEMANQFADAATEAIPKLIDAMGDIIPIAMGIFDAVTLAADGINKLTLADVDLAGSFRIMDAEAEQVVYTVGELSAALELMYSWFPRLAPGANTVFEQMEQGAAGAYTYITGLFTGLPSGLGTVTPDSSAGGGASPAAEMSKDMKDMLATTDMLKMSWTEMGMKLGETANHTKTMAEQQKLMTIQLADEAAAAEQASLQRRQQMYQTFASGTANILRSAFRGATIDMEAMFVDALANMASSMLQSGILKLLGVATTGPGGLFL